MRRRSRREFLWNTGSGLGALAFSSLLGESRAGAAPIAVDPLAPKPPHFAPKVKSVIWVFMEGGPSHVDLFDPKPELEKLAGQPLPASFGKPMTAMGTGGNTLMPSKRTWKQHGQSGIWVSDWYPNIASPSCRGMRLGWKIVARCGFRMARSPLKRRAKVCSD